MTQFTLTSIDSEKILVVENEFSLRQVLVRLVRQSGFRSFSGTTVAEALEILDRESIDLVLADFRKLGSSGFDLMGHLQWNHSHVPYLMFESRDISRLAMQSVTHESCAAIPLPAPRNSLHFQIVRSLAHRRFYAAVGRQNTSWEQQLREQIQRVNLAHQELVHRLVAASMVRDDETGAHIKRIGFLSAALARAADWSEEEIDAMRLAAPMHDVGKIGIPDSILLKPGKLTPEEYEIMKTHTIIGESILRNSEFPFLQRAQQIARSHHEWWDGTGYPDMLCGQEIPPSARIVAIVDVYDALSHDRVYRPALPEEEVLRHLRQGRARQFDPELLDVFLEYLPEIRAAAILEQECYPGTHASFC